MTSKAIAIGGGLAGLQTAWFLANEGIDTTVLERSNNVDKDSVQSLRGPVGSEGGADEV